MPILTPQQQAEKDRLKSQGVYTQTTDFARSNEGNTPAFANTTPNTPFAQNAGQKIENWVNPNARTSTGAPTGFIQAGANASDGYIPNPNATYSNQPVPGSAGSIFGDMTEAEKFQNQYYKNLNDQYNTPIDEAAIRKQKEADYQAQLDSVKAIYADQLNQARVRGQGRQGSSSAIQARRGLLGSNVGEAMTNNIETLNVQEQDLVRQEEANAIAAIQGLIRSGANEEIAARKKAIKEGGESLLAYYAGAGDRKAKKTTDAAKKLLALGKDPSAISDADLATAGIDKNDLLAEYNTLKASQKAAADKVKADALKTQLDNEKTMAETGKLYTDANMPREIGGYIYDAQGNPIGTKYEKPDKPEYLKYEGENPDGSKYSYYVNPATGQKVDPIKTFGADVGYKVDLNAILGGYSPKGQELLSVPDGTVIPTRLGQVSSQNASVRGKECAEYVNDIAGTKMGNTYASKVAVCNEPTGGVGSVVAWKPNGSGNFGHTGIIVGEDANNYFVKSSNYVPGTVTTEKVPKGNIKNFYTPDAVKVQRLPPVSKEILSGLEDLLSSPGFNSAVGFGFQKLNFGNQTEDGFLPGTEAENFRAKFNSFRDNMVLPNLSKLKGPMSDKDIQFLRNSATSLSLSMTEKAFKAELQKIKDKLMGISDEDIVNTY